MFAKLFSRLKGEGTPALRKQPEKERQELSSLSPNLKEQQASARERKRQWKLDQIVKLAREHDVRMPPDFGFRNESPEGRYLLSLQRQLISEKLTMLGNAKLNCLRYCAEEAIKNRVPGDFIETGVWKGGASILLAGVLKANGETGRKVIVADSFAGLPPPDTSKWPVDEGAKQYTRPELAIGLDEVRDNFAKFDLLSNNVVFVEGFFEESLKTAPIDRLAILRLDGDMYGSTMTVLQQLYHKLEIGGFLILDDWLLRWAQKAFLDFREEMGVREQLYQASSSVFFRKEIATEPMSEQRAFDLARRSAENFSKPGSARGVHPFFWPKS
jgi:hypothetical protein